MSSAGGRGYLQVLTLVLMFPQCVFLVWCMAPVSWNGSEVLYRRVIRPFFLRHESAVDRVVSDLTSKAKVITEKVTREGETPRRHRGASER